MDGLNGASSEGLLKMHTWFIIDSFWNDSIFLFSCLVMKDWTYLKVLDAKHCSVCLSPWPDFSYNIDAAKRPGFA